MSVALADVAMPFTAAAAERAAVWLVRTWADRDVDDSVLAVEALALGHVCRLLCPSTSVIADEVATSVALAVPTPDWTGPNLLSSLLASVGALGGRRNTASSADQYLRLLEELLPESANAANTVLVRLALYGVEGLAPLAGRGDSCDARRLRGDADNMRQSLADIETSTVFGTRAMQSDPAVSIVLEGAAIAALRTYDLPMAMRLLRARRYLGDAASYGMAVGFDFLRCCQGFDGGFGDFDTSLSQMVARGDSNGALRLKLPVTLQALWTMAELEEPGFRLAASAFPGLRRRTTANADPGAD
jgi:hypothetical protein